MLDRKPKFWLSVYFLFVLFCSYLVYSQPLQANIANLSIENSPNQHLLRWNVPLSPRSTNNSSLYLPILPSPCAYIFEEEPNDTFSQSDGPTMPGIVYLGCFSVLNDQNDIYYLDLGVRSSIEATLIGISLGHDYDLVIYNSDFEIIGESKNSGNLDEHILTEEQNANQRYYIQVFNFSESVSQTPYKLNISYSLPSQSCIAWEFNNDGDHLGWEVGRNLSPFIVEGGFLKTEVTASDPYMLSAENLNIDSTLFTRFYLGYIFITPDIQAQLLWANPKFGGGNDADFGIIGDGKWRETEVDLNNYPEWEGIISQLRLDPVKFESSGIIHIDYIRLCSES